MPSSGMGQYIMFQFLLGTLKTPASSIHWYFFHMFQFLLGTLKTWTAAAFLVPCAGFNSS